MARTYQSGKRKGPTGEPVGPCGYGGLAAIERRLETRMNARFQQTKNQFIPPVVPPICLCYPTFSSLDLANFRSKKSLKTLLRINAIS
jgi:hypothetical protein